MNKVTRKEMFFLLKNKKDRTFKELSQISGYHEKYLIKIYPLVIEDSISYISKSRGRTSKRKISNNLILEIKELYKSNYWSNKKEFYNYLLENNINTPSYSLICKILKENKNYTSLCIMTKYKLNDNYIYVAFDYQTLKRLVIIRENNNKKAFLKMLKKVITNFGAPINLSVETLFPHNKKYYQDYIKKFNILEIKRDKTIKKAVRKIRNNLNVSNKNCQVMYRQIKFENRDFYFQKLVKINCDKTFQYQNIRYQVLNNSFIKKEAIIYFNNINEIKYIKQDNLLSEVKILKKLTSKKGLSKY